MQRPLLVFLHGLGGTAQIWRPIAAGLENRWQCVALDQRGHGKSQSDINHLLQEPASGFHALDFGGDVLETLQNEKQTIVLIGHSMGVRSALATVHLNGHLPPPARLSIAAVVALDLGLSRQWGGGMGIPLGNFLRDLPAFFRTREDLKHYLGQHCPDPAIAQYLSAVSKLDEASETWRFPFHHGAVVRTLEQAHQAPLGDWLIESSKWGIQFLFLHGKKSKVWSETDYLDQKNRFESPSIQFESWPDAGHGLPFEQRQRFTERLEKFTAALQT